MDIGNWMRKGEHWVWLSGSAVSLTLIAILGLLLMISYNGLVHFWPNSIYTISYKEESKNKTMIGSFVRQVELRAKIDGKENVEVQNLINTGNRDKYGLDFAWINTNDLSKKINKQIVVVERLEWGNAIGIIEFDNKIHNFNKLQEYIKKINKHRQKIKDLEIKKIGEINYQIKTAQTKIKKLAYQNKLNAINKKQLESEISNLKAEYQSLKIKRDKFEQKLTQNPDINLLIDDKQGAYTKIKIPLSHVLRVYQPNFMTWWQKLSFAFDKFIEFLVENPREANTEGGVFPAIFGTFAMVVLMTIFVTPMGIIAAIYLKEYARDGFMVRLVRVAVSNLAGVPSIVFGIFGLGFFVYFLGGAIDELFYPYNLPSPTYGSPAILWASLTLALLTLPVVIVSTEEGLSRIPLSMRESSYALGATKLETIMKVVIPMASPSMMTGLILSIARAAGEVAPLMLVGAVKLAPDLPFDSNAPFVHLERKFMHLGFHIYDLGFQSPNVEAAQPHLYTTALLLILIILLLNITAIYIRNKLRNKYSNLG